MAHAGSSLPVRSPAAMLLGPVAAAALAAMVVSGFATSAAADCTCRLSGQDLPLGTTACLSPSGRQGLYRCSMNLNITSWNRVGDLCPVAALPLPESGPRAPPGEGHTGSRSLLR